MCGLLNKFMNLWPHHIYSQGEEQLGHSVWEGGHLKLQRERDDGARDVERGRSIVEQKIMSTLAGSCEHSSGQHSGPTDMEFVMILLWLAEWALICIPLITGRQA